MTTERVGRYQLLEPIGVGPDGSVSRAKVFGVAGFERQFAVKRFHPELTTTAAMAQALSAAARAYGGLEHPRIARMSEFGVAQGTTFTAVEYVVGLDALRLVNEARATATALAAGGALALVSQAARAVGYAHGRGLTHLGLAPTNVIVTAEGDVKITDFGILSATLPPRPIDHARLAQRIQYLAPEQLANEATSAATDVFALGVLAYELVTAQRTFKGETPQQIAQSVMAGPPGEPPLPRPIVRVLQRCLARSPFERFPDARALADALDAALRVAPVPGTRKDIGSQVKATLDRLDEMHSGELSGMVALNLGTANMLRGPSAPVATLGTREPQQPQRESQAAMDLATTEFVRGDKPSASAIKPDAVDTRPANRVTPLPADLGASTMPDLPKMPMTTVTGLAPPPIPVPKGVSGPPTPTPASTPNPGTLLGLPSSKPKPMAVPAIPAPAAPKAPFGGTLARPATPPPIPRPGAPRPPTHTDKKHDDGLPGALVHTPTPPPRPAAARPASESATVPETVVERADAVADLGLDDNSAVGSTLLLTPSKTPPTPRAKTPIEGPALRAFDQAPERPSETPVSPLRMLQSLPASTAPAVAPIAPPAPPESLSVEMSIVETPLDDDAAPHDDPDDLGALDKSTKVGFGPDAFAALAESSRSRSRHVTNEMPPHLVEQLSEAAKPTSEMSPLLEAAYRAPTEDVPIDQPTDIPSIAGAASRQYPIERAAVPMSKPLLAVPVPPLPPVAPPARRSRLPWILAGVVVMLGLAAAAYFVVLPIVMKEETVAKPGSGTPAPADAAVVATANDAGTASTDATAIAPVTADAGVAAVPEDAAAKPTGDLVITSTPPGARVFIDGSDAGTTPLKQPGTADRHTIALLQAGHELYVAQVDGRGSFEIPLKEVTPSGGPAGIKVIQCKAKDRYYVFVDGKPTGQTCPTERIECELGPHTVEVYDVVSETRRKWEINITDTRLSYRVRID